MRDYTENIGLFEVEFKDGTTLREKPLDGCISWNLDERYLVIEVGNKYTVFHANDIESLCIEYNTNKQL